MGAIDRYLDELFDRLSGTGGVGRRALAETEDHLRTAASEGVAAGLPEDQAEEQSVTRFGPAAQVAGQFRRVRRRPLATMVSGTWLLTGVGLLGVGASYLASAVLRWFLPQPSLPPCSQAPATVDACNPTTGTTNGGIVAETLSAGLVILAAAAIVLLGWRWAVRSRAIPGMPRRLPGLAATLLFLAALYLYGRPDTPYIIDQGVGARVSAVDVLVALLGAVLAFGWAFARRHHPPEPE
jgi:hypothetical protein